MDWQPISSAPRDGTLVILWSRIGPGGADLYYRANGVWNSPRGFLSDGDATHWMPLPPPPKE